MPTGQTAQRGGKHPKLLHQIKSLFPRKKLRTQSNSHKLWPPSSPLSCFVDYADFRFHTTSDPPKNVVKKMFMECSGKPSTDWQRRWLIRRLIKFKKYILDNLPYPDWHLQNKTFHNSTRKPLLPRTNLKIFIHDPYFDCDRVCNPKINDAEKRIINLFTHDWTTKGRHNSFYRIPG